MAKKKGKRVDPDKKAALTARKEAKAEKAASKRLNKTEDAGQDDDDNEESDENIDHLIRLYKEQDAGPGKLVASDGFPPPRSNATFTVTKDTKKKDVYLFGGEYFDGEHNVASDQLFKFELASQKWKQIKGSPRPPPRCAHSTVYFNRCLYVFGGEISDGSGGYKHYRDLWKFDTNSLAWAELKSPGCPFPRSGHSAVAWKHFLIVFGGFYDSASKEAPRWFDDICVFNLQTEQWVSIPHSKLTQRPAPRSGCNTALVDDQWIVHGGFSKRPRRADSAGTPGPEGMAYSDAWILRLEPLLSENPPAWERCVSSLSSQKQTEAAELSANGRSGCGSVTYSKNMLLFGGVVDQEMHHHVMDSIFFNDLSILHIEKRKFLPLQTRNDEDVASIHDDSATRGWNLEKMRSNLFGFLDSDGNLVFEKSHGIDPNDESLQESHLTKIIERSEPLPRIKCSLFMDGSTLYIYGGILEVGDREVTLDDMWCIDLRKTRRWECIFPGTMHKQVWLGGVYDDNDSYCSTADSTGRNEDESDDDDDADNEEPDKTQSLPAEGKSYRDQINELVDRFHLDAAGETPEPEEDLVGFTERTLTHWTKSAAPLGEGGSGEDCARRLAKERFDEVEPIIEKVKQLVLARKEQKKADKKTRRSDRL